MFLEDVCTGPLQPIQLFLHRCVQLKQQGREPATALSMAQTRKPVTPLPWARVLCEGAKRLCLGLPRKVKVHWWGREGAHTSVQQSVTISKAFLRGGDSYFFQTHSGGIAFQGKSEAEEIRRTVISVAFPKADSEEQVPLLPETVFQSHSLCF